MRFCPSARYSRVFPPPTDLIGTAIIIPFPGISINIFLFAFFISFFVDSASATVLIIAFSVISSPYSARFSVVAVPLPRFVSTIEKDSS